MKDSLILTKTILRGMIGTITLEEDKYDYENEPRWTYQSYRLRGDAESMIVDIDQLLRDIQKEAVDETG